jgi:hypothetical protein
MKYFNPNADANVPAGPATNPDVANELTKIVWFEKKAVLTNKVCQNCGTLIDENGRCGYTGDD